MKSYFSDFIV